MCVCGVGVSGECVEVVSVNVHVHQCKICVDHVTAHVTRHAVYHHHACMPSMGLGTNTRPTHTLTPSHTTLQVPFRCCPLEW